MSESEKKAVTVATPQTNPIPAQNNQSFQVSRHTQALSDEGAWALANRIKSSTIIPKDFINKPENIFIAMLMGREVGLSPMQAVQNIMVVNGKPCMWGDALPALVYASGLVDKFEEEIDPKGQWARCTVRRKGDTKDHVQEFTWADAQKARLHEKPGPWQTNPKRMLQMRARAFALRDKFPDALKGIGLREEIEDYDLLDRKEAAKQIQMPKEVIDVTEKAEAFSKQEPVPADVPSDETPAEDTPPKKNEAATEHPLVKKAKAQFLEKHRIDSATIDLYLMKHNLTTFGEIYPRLQTLWKDIKSGKTTIEQEFEGLLPSADNDELPFE